MHRRSHALVLLLALPALAQAAPVELARESFEGAGGAIGFTTSIPTFEVSAATVNDYFKIVPNNGSKLAGGILTGADGSSIFAAEDIDTAPNNNPPTVSLTTNSVSISGKTNTSVRLLLAAPGSGPAGGGSQNFYDWSATAADIDFVRVEASIDGGPFTRLAQYSPSTATLNQPLSLDADGDGLGGGAALTAAFQEFIYSVPTGNTIQVRVVMHSNATNEYICVDNIRIFGEAPATAPPVIGGVPGTPLVFAEGSPAVAVAPALTVADPDSANLTSATVVISANNIPAEDVLSVTPSGAILAGDISYSAATGTLTISRSAPVSTYQTVLRSVSYRDTNAVNPNTSVRQVRFNVSDGVNPSNAPLREIQVTDSVGVQSLPFTESFETDGRGTRYALTGRFTNGTALFDRGQPTGVTNQDGTFAVIAEDTLLDAAPVKSVDFALNTAGFVNTTAVVRLGTVGGAIFDTGDSVAVEASVDGGGFVDVGTFQSMAATNSTLALDTDNNGTGDGLQLGTALKDVTCNLPVGSVTTLRIRCQSNTSAERIVVDRVVVSGSLQQFSINDVSAPESNGLRTFTVTRTVSTGQDTVNYATSDGTALAGSDYTAASGTVTLNNGEAAKTFTVAVSQDSLVELDESFAVTLTSPSRGLLLDATGAGTIANEDASVLGLTGGTVTEGDIGNVLLTFDYSLTNPVDTAVTFSRATSAGGTAAAGTDFTVLASTATSIAASGLSGSFTVSVIGDHAPEPSETVGVLLASLAAGGRSVTFTGGGATLSASGTITDDDPVIVAGAGSLGLRIGVSGKLTVAGLIAAASGGEGALTVSGVQSLPTAGGGLVTLADGWISYQPAPGFSGADSFTYTLTDGFQSMTGTVQVVADNGIGTTANIASMTSEGAGKRLVGFGIPARVYQWQTSSDLAVWTSLGPPVVCPAAGVLSILDPGPLPP
ncbi:MAG: hypothetical protein JWL81_3099, partial [Verrucomicrobiales bacterium]|nr:hypothetical protein [Verrucomicrobiales bacterium]